jgi:hypothetical protein
MRTTLTLDPDVAMAVRRRVRASGQSLKAVVNDGLRHGLQVASKPPARRRFKVKARRLGLRPGIDPNRLNQLVDELEVEAFAEKYSR